MKQYIVKAASFHSDKVQRVFQAGETVTEEQLHEGHGEKAVADGFLKELTDEDKAQILRDWLESADEDEDETEETETATNEDESMEDETETATETTESTEEHKDTETESNTEESVTSEQNEQQLRETLEATGYNELKAACTEKGIEYKHNTAKSVLVDELIKWHQQNPA